MDQRDAAVQRCESEIQLREAEKKSYHDGWDYLVDVVGQRDEALESRDDYRSRYLDSERRVMALMKERDGLQSRLSESEESNKVLHGKLGNAAVTRTIQFETQRQTELEISNLRSRLKEQSDEIEQRIAEEETLVKTHTSAVAALQKEVTQRDEELRFIRWAASQSEQQRRQVQQKASLLEKRVQRNERRSMKLMESRRWLQAGLDWSVEHQRTLRRRVTSTRSLKRSAAEDSRMLARLLQAEHRTSASLRQHNRTLSDRLCQVFQLARASLLAHQNLQHELDGERHLRLRAEQTEGETQSLFRSTCLLIAGTKVEAGRYRKNLEHTNSELSSITTAFDGFLAKIGDRVNSLDTCFRTTPAQQVKWLIKLLDDLTATFDKMEESLKHGYKKLTRTSWTTPDSSSPHEFPPAIQRLVPVAARLSHDSKILTAAVTLTRAEVHAFDFQFAALGCDVAPDDGKGTILELVRRLSEAATTVAKQCVELRKGRATNETRIGELQATCEASQSEAEETRVKLSHAAKELTEHKKMAADIKGVLETYTNDRCKDKDLLTRVLGLKKDIGDAKAIIKEQDVQLDSLRSISM